MELRWFTKSVFPSVVWYGRQALKDKTEFLGNENSKKRWESDNLLARFLQRNAANP
jgi:hypothetical protein